MKQAIKAEKTQKQILDAATEIFAEKGYHNTRVDDIVDASGTSKGSVYFHFPSKEKIFLSIIERFSNILANSLKDAIEAEASGIDQVDAALRICLEVFSRYRQLAKIFIIQASGLGEVFEDKRQEINLRFIKIIQTYLDKAIQQGDIPEIDTEIAAMAWIGALYEIIMRWVLTDYPPPERILPNLRQILLRSIGVSEARILQIQSDVK